MRSSSPDLCDGDGGSSIRLLETEIESGLEAGGGRRFMIWVAVLDGGSTRDENPRERGRVGGQDRV